jgi:hypothetical protein
MPLDHKGFSGFSRAERPLDAKFSLTAQKCHALPPSMDAPPRLA